MQLFRQEKKKKRIVSSTVVCSKLKIQISAQMVGVWEVVLSTFISELYCQNINTCRSPGESTKQQLATTCICTIFSGIRL